MLEIILEGPTVMVLGHRRYLFSGKGLAARRLRRINGNKKVKNHYWQTLKCGDPIFTRFYASEDTYLRSVTQDIHI